MKQHGSIRLPRSAVRGQKSYAKLLTDVPRDALSGFDFHGTFVKPGSLIHEEDLCPTPHHPPTPILLEHAGLTLKPETGWRRHRQPTVHILWRFDRAACTWTELGRTCATGSDWVFDLRDLAARAIEEQRPVQLQRKPVLREVEARIRRAIDTELSGLSREDRTRVLAALYDELASGMCA